MGVSSFLSDVGPDAQIASSYTGVPASVIAAQWGVETGWGTSSAWKTGHNYAGIMGSSARPQSYPDRASGLWAYINTLLEPRYTSVRSAGSPQAAASALGQSPWDAGHYVDPAAGGSPGSSLLQVMQQNNLSVLDSGGASTTPKAVPASTGSGIADSVVSGLVSAVKRPLLMGIFVLGGMGLVVAGGWRAVSPKLGPTIDKAKEALTTAAVAAA